MNADWFLVLWDTDFGGNCWINYAHRTANIIPQPEITGFVSFLASTIAHHQIVVLMITKAELVQLVVTDGREGIFRRTFHPMTMAEIRQIIQFGGYQDALNREGRGNWADQQWFIHLIESLPRR